VAYGLEFLYLQERGAAWGAPAISFAYLGDLHAGAVDTVLGSTSGIPGNLAAADQDLAPTLTGIELQAADHTQHFGDLDGGINGLLGERIDGQYGPADAALDDAGVHLGVLNNQPSPDASPGPRPDIPANPFEPDPGTPLP
jgi:hypothetical protein